MAAKTTSSQTQTSGAAPSSISLASQNGFYSIFQGLLFALLCSFSAEFLLYRFLAQDYLHEQLVLGGLGRVLVLFLSLFILHRFTSISTLGYRPRLKDVICMSVVLIGCTVMLALGRLLAESLSSYFQTPGSRMHLPAEAFYFAIPFASGALLLQAVLGFHFAMVLSISLSLIVGVYSPHSEILSPLALTTSLTACLSLSRFRSRSANVKAGFYVAVVSLPFALSYIISTGEFVSDTTIVTLAAALTGGILCTLVAAGITPVIEYMGGYVTDMRLIEMATLDHPLLKELSVNAPGTWNHSMVMGMMVEAAADAVGANPVLARVGAYFHDVGKMKKPLYFVENQGGSENRHEKLSTSMSALIIRSHVKDGMELSRKFGLPLAIEDMIPQHHGTSRIEYFYDKACKEAEEAGLEVNTVDESLYRYPGPKPQTREAGILMLADGIEAAARTLSDPTQDRIQGMVQKMINKVFSSGELNECDLTLRDLHLIAKCFTRVLTGIYHQRIAYAEPAEKTKTSDEAPLPEDSKEMGSTGPQKKQKAGAEDKGAKEASPEDLKRLGM